MTGAASGIGRAGALALAAHGASVAAADLNLDGARETVAQIERAGGHAIAVECDVTDEAQVHALVSSTVATFGGLDAAFNNAGGAFDEAPLHETSREAWEQSITVNLTSVFLCMKHEIAHMREHGGGSIVNTASGAARVPAPGRSPYSAAKRGVVALTAHGAQDYRREGIRVNAVLPGIVDTPPVRDAVIGKYGEDAIKPFLPLGRLGQPDEIAELVVWLCSPAASFVSGQAIVADGGGILC